MTKLELWDNKIGPEGAIAIAEALKVNAVVPCLGRQPSHSSDRESGFGSGLEGYWRAPLVSSTTFECLDGRHEDLRVC